MCSGAGDTTQLVPGYPIRTPWDHSSVDSSPRPIAASHVLHRPLVPRHPPSALTNLPNTQNTHIPKTNHRTPKNARVHYANLNPPPTHHQPDHTTQPNQPCLAKTTTPPPPGNGQQPHPGAIHGCSLRTSTGCLPCRPTSTTAAPFPPPHTRRWLY